MICNKYGGYDEKIFKEKGSPKILFGLNNNMKE